jgi:hypothetical protein
MGTGIARLQYVAGASVLALMASCAGESGDPSIELDADDIGGTVTSAQGPEAGVWVIAETTSLPTTFSRTVVTDDQGRYVVPDLPAGDYEVFVRGYGLVDSPRQPAMPGQYLDLTAEVAPTPGDAAEYYPAAYWLAMMDKPAAGCGLACHQIGNKATREIPSSIAAEASDSLDAWIRRVAVGPEGPGMAAGFNRLGDDRQAFADWTDRVAQGELPPEAPPRPTGVERNLVVSVWDWGTKFDGRTDSVASDLRDGSVNPNGPVYMVARSTDILAVLEPSEHRIHNLQVPSNAPEMHATSRPSPYWGDEPIWHRRADPRSLAMDARGRAWLTARLREEPGQPAFCTSQTNTFARYYPVESSDGGPTYGATGRQLIVYDPQTEEFTPIVDACFSLDHNQLGSDDFLYFGVDNAVFWIDTKTWDETQDTEASQGWCPAVVDTNGDGTITEWTEPDEPVNPMLDQRIEFGCYQIAVDPNEPTGVLWCGSNRELTRIELGSNAPETCKAEVYRPPTGHSPEVSGSGHAIVDGDGVVWMIWRGSQHLTSFDHRKCTATSGLGGVDGQSCPEGWTVHLLDAPTYAGTDIQSDMTYLPQVDRHDALGLGRDVPLYGTVNTDMLVAFLPDTEQFVRLLVPYPIGFFSRSSNGRIDDPSAGWKGKGIWSSFSTYAPWHVEGGYADGGSEGHGSKAVRFQMRPSPLAK